MKLLLVNPNTSVTTTAAMLAIAREAAPAGVELAGATAAFGAALITDEAKLATAAEAVVSLLREIADPGDGVIVAAFGDPGLAQLRDDLGRRRPAVPVTGIAEAAFLEARRDGRVFAVATTTPGHVGAITALAAAYGHGAHLRGVFLTPGDPATLMADPDGLVAALETACRAAIGAGAEAVVIGGGPLAVAARALRATLPVPIIEPVPAAVRLAVERARANSGGP